MSVNAAVLDHGMGNLRSVSKALEATGASTVVTADRATIERADVLCVPGQGIFGRCVENMARTGSDELTKGWIARGRPFLGICLGMQVLFRSSDEDDVPGLGVFEGHVTRLPTSVRVPHIGWNEVEPSGAGTVERGYFYFDHSYAVLPADPTIVSGWCDHGRRFAAAIETRSLLGVQFHPEKSGVAGIALLRRWLEKVALEDASTMEKRT
jgi:glutamine amidotransferase